MKDYNSIPETADLEEPTDTKFMMAVPMMFNKSKKYKGRGQSILEKKLDAFDSFDEVWSKWIDALRDNRTITYIPEDLIPTNQIKLLLNSNLLFEPILSNNGTNKFTSIILVATPSTPKNLNNIVNIPKNIPCNICPTEVTGEVTGSVAINTAPNNKPPDRIWNTG